MVFDVNKLMDAFEKEHQFKDDDLFYDLPGLCSTSNEKDPLALKKITGTLLPWSWYIIEGDRKTGILMAYVEGDFNEIGSVYLKEIHRVGGVMDKDFKPTRLSKIMS